MGGSALFPRHIQNLSDASSLEHHWGYADRAVPCTNDAGSCAYLDAVYNAHDAGMIYTAAIWGTIGLVLLVLGFIHVVRANAAPVARRGSSIARGKRAIAAGLRRIFLPEGVRIVFGRTTRLQVTILAVMAAYLLLWTFLGYPFKTWVTPVKNKPGLYNTRTSLGPFADRVGVLAYAMTPLSVLFSSRESILSIITGIPHHHFIFLHRWLGYIILMQAALHTIGWSIVEIRLYQPQPSTAQAWIKQTYMVWGVVAMILLLLLWALSTQTAIRYTGYEFFRKAHYVLAMVYIGACYGHWDQLSCFLLPSLILWFIDRSARFVRTALLHYNYVTPQGASGFRAAQARARLFPDSPNGDVVRLDFEHPHQPWKVGQHFYLTFTEGSIWQSHPFTPISYPILSKGTTRHSYIFRAKQGETHKIANKLGAAAGTAAGNIPESNASIDSESKNAKKLMTTTTAVILTGPYGQSIVDDLLPAYMQGSNTNILCVAGGTGITFVLPVLWHLAHLDAFQGPRPCSISVALVWAIRRKQDVLWVEEELDALRAIAGKCISIEVYVTRGVDRARVLRSATSSSVEKGQGTIDCSKCDEDPAPLDLAPDAADAAAATAEGEEGGPEAPYLLRRPDLHAVVTNFVDSTACGPTTVFASGPGGMISELRDAVASCNSAGRVWKGDDRADVSLVSDNRLEW
ncbi:ferric reductase like transmembrane component [Tilletiaria anomala UBC 951]|uniref:Ferric reductase like transmembrane component n=1 Tax=Tilletiaria anomala (strain ATCC 24038 / CBS 436.72 / UBC 951) TaxID=1037660 RepID=A0A066WG15_TILAU|nr:ferric reductase like transmembrane component [Tilletiaria anomala UBC 951]KDN52892.1 ferric reductase like transmembrane component [Tilletiaria anomala UBC 951]